jgi:putative hydrolase of the HAD superfamily
MIPYGSTKRILMKPKKFCGLMEDYLSHQGISKVFKVRIDNLKLYDLQRNQNILSMIEAAMISSNNTLPMKS